MKVPQHLSRIEQETVFRTNALNEGWEVSSRDPVWKRRLEKRGYTVKQDGGGLWSAVIPMSSLTIRSANQKKRELSPRFKAHSFRKTPRTDGSLATSEPKPGVLSIPETEA